MSKHGKSIFRQPNETAIHVGIDTNAGKVPDKPWAISWEEIAAGFNVSVETGLDTKEADHRLAVHGPNSLREIKPQSAWVILTNQFKSFIVIFLLAAAGLSFIMKEFIDGTAIFAVIIINGIIGFITELKGIRSIETLRKLGSVSSRVRRDGHLLEISAENLVPGDIAVLEGGDVISADLRIVKASKLEADESILTGESMPVGKVSGVLPEDTLLAERMNMLYKGTALTRGSVEAVVVGTGMQTELGRISALVEETEEQTTPLEKRLSQLGQWLIYVIIAIAAAIAISGIIQGKEAFLMIETGIALAVAAIPEGLPIVATIALARGVWRMARKNALIKQLSAVETLGATSVICTDKTGTLTENKMTVTRISLSTGEFEIRSLAGDKSAFLKDGKPVDPLGDKAMYEALRIGVLCNNASIRQHGKEGKTCEVGDPLEVALLVVASKAGLNASQLQNEMPEMNEEAFDSDVKMMATYNKKRDGYLVSVKGAPEPVLEACSAIFTGDISRTMTDAERKDWLDKNNNLAANGLRVLALASKKTNSPDEKPYYNLTFSGLLGLLDPARSDIPEVIELCRQSGIRVVMVTGDQPVTARAIGSAIGLVDNMNSEVVHGRDLKKFEELSEEERHHLASVSLFARVSPKQKLDLIDIHRKNGAIVGMTGDGVNDAPALKKADIGIAMGLRGTQVAREAADMVLNDDSFSSIVYAIEQGRIIFDNIRKFVFFLLSCNISEVMTVAIASFINVPLPVLPLQILFINIVTDVFPALALAASEGNPGIMKRKPRNPKEPIMSRRYWIGVGGYGTIITVSVLGALILAINWLHLDEVQNVTVSFLTLAFAQLWHVFNMRDTKSGLIRNDITRNPFVWGALAICSGILAAAVYLPGLSNVLRVKSPGPKGWALAIVMSSLVMIIGQIRKVIVKRLK